MKQRTRFLLIILLVIINALIVIQPTQGKETLDVEARRASIDEPFSALIFKIMSDPHVGTLSFFRIYSGKTKIGSTVYNSTKGEEERISFFRKGIVGDWKNHFSKGDLKFFYRKAKYVLNRLGYII